jgi:uncharacterized protein YndB with AHSA1/START domain
MTMVDILHRVGVVAPLNQVYASISTVDGLAAWWTSDTTDTSEVGGTLAFRFGEVGGFDMEVVTLEPEGHVRWRVTGGPSEWVGTEIDWRLEQRDEYTIVLFTHEGWREPVEFMNHCSTKWAIFLMSLKELIETGTGHPAPDDVPISDWH